MATGLTAGVHALGPELAGEGFGSAGLEGTGAEAGGLSGGVRVMRGFGVDCPDHASLYICSFEPPRHLLLPMYNSHTYAKRLYSKQVLDQEAIKQARIRQRSTLLRSVLAEKYSKRVDQFIVTMMNDPVQVNQHQSPLEVAGRDPDPEKFKGPPFMIMKGYRTEQERVKEAVAANRFLSLEPMRQHEFRSRDQSKEINPSMYFTSKPNLAKRNSPLPVSPSGHSKSQSVSIDFARKTHFKGVMSKLMDLSMTAPKEEAIGEGEDSMQVLQRTKTASLLWKHGQVLNRTSLQKYEGAALAKDVLQSCQVIPKAATGSFLRVGEGKLISNPFIPTRDLYSHLYQGTTASTSSFST